jgi:hypothetical protein
MFDVFVVLVPGKAFWITKGLEIATRVAIRLIHLFAGERVLNKVALGILKHSSIVLASAVSESLGQVQVYLVPS